MFDIFVTKIIQIGLAWEYLTNRSELYFARNLQNLFRHTQEHMHKKLWIKKFPSSGEEGNLRYNGEGINYFASTSSKTYRFSEVLKYKR